MNTFNSIRTGGETLAALLIVSSIAACSSSSSTTTDGAAEADDSAINASTLALKQNAAQHFGRSIESGVASTTDLSYKTGGMIDMDASLENTETTPLYYDTNALINASLALNDDTEERTLRDGTVLTIDPDESDFCTSLQADIAEDEMQSCLELFRNLEIQLVATSDDTGVISYFLDNALFLELGYSPTHDSSTLHLAGLQELISKFNSLEPESDYETFPDSMRGAITISASSDESTMQNSMSIEVSEAIEVLSSESGDTLTLEASKLFDMSLNNNTGLGYIEFNIGAFASESTNSDNNHIEQFNLAGLTGRFELTGDGDELVVTNFGIGNGDMVNLSNSVETSRTVLSKMGFTLNNNESRIVITEDLNYSSTLNFHDFIGLSGDSTASVYLQSLITLTVPAGSIIKEYASNYRKLETGGPLTYLNEYTYDHADGTENMSQTGTLTVNAGECFDTSYDQDYSAGKVVLCPNE